MLHEDSVQNWMLSTLSVSNIISESMALKDRIKLESVPCDDYIEMVIEAMKKGVSIAVKYRKYGSDKFSNLNFEPYCLKMFMHGVGMSSVISSVTATPEEGADYYGVFSFDRILEMEITDIPFVKDEFDAQEYFSECMGVISWRWNKSCQGCNTCIRLKNVITYVIYHFINLKRKLVREKTLLTLSTIFVLR